MKVFHLCWKEWVLSFLILLCPRKPAAAAHMEPLVNSNTEHYMDCTLGIWTRIWAIKLWPLSCLITKQRPFNTILFSFCSYSPVRTGRGLTRLFVSTPPPTPEAVSASHIVKMRQILNPDKGIYLLPISDITVRTLEHASNLESSQPGEWRV